VKKLALKIDALRVESFEVAAPERTEGTVCAHADARFHNSIRTQCVTGICDCVITDPSCEVVCG
jgi:hypothetical protein